MLEPGYWQITFNTWAMDGTPLARTTQNPQTTRMHTPEKLQQTCAMKRWPLIKQRAAVLILAMASSILMVGCNNLSNRHLDSIANVDPGIGYLDGKFRICRENCPKRTEKVLDDADYAVMQDAPVSIQQPEPPITQPVSTAAPANERADIFIVQFEFGKSVPTNDGFKTLALLTNAARQTAAAIELIGETEDRKSV